MTDLKPRIAMESQSMSSLENGSAILAGKLLDINGQKNEVLLGLSDDSKISVQLKEDSILHTSIGSVVEIIVDIEKTNGGLKYTEVISAIHQGDWSPEAYKTSVNVAYSHPELFGWGN